MQPHLSWLLMDRIANVVRRCFRPFVAVRHSPFAFEAATVSATPARLSVVGSQPTDATPRWRDMMVFRKESRADSFQRQISALRQQLSTDQDEEDMYPVIDDATPMPGGSEDALIPAPRAALPMSATGDDGHVGVIAANSNWNGTMRTEGSLRVLGHVEGELIAAEQIYIAEGATVHARVSAG